MIEDEFLLHVIVDGFLVLIVVAISDILYAIGVFGFVFDGVVWFSNRFITDGVVLQNVFNLFTKFEWNVFDIFGARFDQTAGISDDGVGFRAVTDKVLFTSTMVTAANITFASISGFLEAVRRS